jgi:hypothetical protein
VLLRGDSSKSTVDGKYVMPSLGNTVSMGGYGPKSLTGRPGSVSKEHNNHWQKPTEATYHKEFSTALEGGLPNQKKLPGNNLVQIKDVDKELPDVVADSIIPNNSNFSKGRRNATKTNTSVNLVTNNNNNMGNFDNQLKIESSRQGIGIIQQNTKPQQQQSGHPEEFGKQQQPYQQQKQEEQQQKQQQKQQEKDSDINNVAKLVAHHKRQIQDKPAGNGSFLMVVMLVTICCVGTVLGLGYCLHQPSRGSYMGQPSTDSPTFQTVKLTFTANVTSPDSHEGTEKLPPPTNQQNTGSRAHLYKRPTNFKNTGKSRLGAMEQLISLDDSDDNSDMIYECPGLAPAGEMVVTNPFFLSGDISHITNNSDSLPCPVSNHQNMRHGSIRGIK